MEITRSLQKGISIIAVIMLLVIVSLFATIINNYKFLNLNTGSSSRMDGRLAEQIALIGLEMGLHEWKNNSNAQNTYTPNTAAFTDYPILGGTLSVYFNSPTNNFNSFPIVIRSVGKYKNAQRTIDISFNLVTVKQMAIIDSTNSDVSLNIRSDRLQDYGWLITHFSETADFPSIINTLTTYNLTYIPSSVNDTFVSNLIDANIPIAFENRQHGVILGLTQTSGQDSAPTTQLYLHNSCFYCSFLQLLPAVPLIASSSNLIFNQFDLTDLSVDTKPELSFDLNSNNVAMTFIETNAQRTSGDPSPNVRVGLPLQASTQSFSNLTNNYLKILDSYLTLGACNFNNVCQKRIEVINWLYINN